MTDRAVLADRLDAHAVRYANDYGYNVAGDLKAAAAALRRPSPHQPPETDESPEWLLACRLAGAELNYRNAYETQGHDHIETGRRWDKMRKAGDAIRAHEPALSQIPASGGEGAAREPTPHWQRRWPHDQPNGWNLDGAAFLKLIQDNPMMWLALGRAKYLELRVDTRDGGFNLYDRDRKPLNPDDVIEAINKARADFGDAASPEGQASGVRSGTFEAMIANLVALDKQRTPGPWRKTHDNITSSDRSVEARLVARCDTDWGGGWKHDATKASKNARFITALENAWPKILAALASGKDAGSEEVTRTQSQSEAT